MRTHPMTDMTHVSDAGKLGEKIDERTDPVVVPVLKSMLRDAVFVIPTSGLRTASQNLALTYRLRMTLSALYRSLDI